MKKKMNTITSKLVQDALGRPLRTLRLSVTDRCNFNCTYCMPDKNIEFLPKDKVLSFEDMLRVVQVLTTLGVTKVKITGGEPTLRVGIDIFISMLKKHTDLKEVALITNGVFLKTLAPRLKKSGLDRVTVSLDALDERIFQKIVGNTHSIHPVLQGIDAAVDSGLLPVKINCVVQKGINENQIIPLVEYFRKPHFQLRFIEYMDVGSIEWKESDVLSSREILSLLEQHFSLEQLVPAYESEVARRYRHADGNGELGFISSVSEPFCQNCDRLRLTADGSLYGCLFASSGKNIKPLLDAHASDEELCNALVAFWQQRADRYSEERAAKSVEHKVAMNFIGG